MSEENENTEGKDEHGLVVHTYRSRVLVVMPSTPYDETGMRYARSALFNIHVGTTSVCAKDDDLIRGSLQDEFQVDGPLDGGVTMEPYSGVIFVAAQGESDLTENQDALRLAREAAQDDKLIAAWGESVGLLAGAGILARKRVTGADGVREAVKAARGRFTGNQVERDGSLVTARDNAAGLRFGKLLAQVVGI